MKKIKDSVEINNKIFKKYLPSTEILKIVKKLAESINKDYEKKCPLFLIVIKGAIFFAADLLRQINIDCRIDTISAKSYGNSLVGSADVKIQIPNIDLSDKDIIIVEDIIDTGNTLKALITELSKKNPRTIEVVAFLLKPSNLKEDIKAKYVGLDIPKDFVVGYGLDYDEQGRTLKDIYKLQ